MYIPEKVSIIRQAMGGLNLPPPPGWEASAVDAQLRKMLQDLQDKTN